MMDPEKKAQWVADLRSGKYEQGAGTLKQFKDHSDVSKGYVHCCLGVLLEGCPELGRWETDSYGTVVFIPNPGVGMPPYSRQISGTLGAMRLTLGVDDAQEPLIEMNDGDPDGNGDTFGKKSFAEIADWIEANPNL